MASRRVNVEPSRVRGSALESGAPGLERVVVIEIPVIDRNAVLARQDPKHRLGVLRSGRGGGFLAEDSVQVIDSGRAGATLASGTSIVESCSVQRFAQHVLAEAASRAFVHEWQARPSPQRQLDEVPRCSMAASMSARRFENARRIGLGMSRNSLRLLRRTCHARPRGASSARSADW